MKTGKAKPMFGCIGTFCEKLFQYAPPMYSSVYEVWCNWRILELFFIGHAHAADFTIIRKLTVQAFQRYQN